MANNSQYGDLNLESFKFYVTSTPCVSSSTANNGRKCYSNSAFDSGYFTRSKAAVSKSSVVEQSDSFPQLNLDITVDNVDPQFDAEYVDQSQVKLCVNGETVNHECQSGMPGNATNIYYTPDVVDQLATSIDVESHSSDGSIHLVTVQQPVDIISQLLPSFPHIVALILCHLSNSDLCRYQISKYL